MKTFLCSLCIFVASCTWAPQQLGTGAASVTVHELDDEGRTVGTWKVPNNSWKLNTEDDTLIAPGIPHPLHSYSIDR